jgi:hypothetical protein
MSKLSISASETVTPMGYPRRSSLALTVSPVIVRTLPMSCTTVSWSTSGRPRQFSVILQKSRCSILFHLDVPGGKCETLIVRPVRSANCRLEAVPARVQELPNFLRADGVPLRPQFLGEAPGTLRRPPQRGLGIARVTGSTQRFQRLHDLGRRVLDARTAAVRPPHRNDVVRGHARAKLLPTDADRRAREPRRACDDRDPAVPQRLCLRACPQPRHALIHHRVKRDELRAYRVLFHPGSRSHKVLLDNFVLLGS